MHRTRYLAQILLIVSASALSMSSSSSAKRPPSGKRFFYVARHGQTDANAADVIQGSADISRLTPKGQSQARNMGTEALSKYNSAITHSCKHIDRIYVSPLTRARDTLAIMRQTAPPDALPPTETVLPNLREIDLYSWEMYGKDELKERYPKSYAAWKAGDPDGVVVNGRKPLRELWERADEVWKEIRALVLEEELSDDVGGEDTATLLVCHGTLGQALLGSAFGLDAKIFRRNTFPNCGMAEIVWHDDDEYAESWRWHYPTPTEYGCLRDQLGMHMELDVAHDRAVSMETT